MDQKLIQRTRYMLQTRFSRIRTSEIGNFEKVCQQVLSWLEEHPIFSGIIDDLDNLKGEHQEEIQRILEYEGSRASRYYYLAIRGDDPKENEPKFVGYTPTNEKEHASACLQLLRAAIAKPDLEFYLLLAIYYTQQPYDRVQFRDVVGVTEDAFRIIQESVSRDVYAYLDEQLDGINAINGLLYKYKQYVEWFHQDHLRSIAELGYEGEMGERALALHLQQYIFNQGVEFTIEPTSSSGEVDLLLRTMSGDYTIIDAKYIKSNSDITRKIAEGFNQVSRYCSDYNQQQGFLAVFVNDDILIQVELEQNDTYQYLEVGDFIIYYVEINIANRPSASKSGRARQHKILATQLMSEMENLSE